MTPSTKASTLAVVAVLLAACISDSSAGKPIECNASSDCPSGQVCSLYDLQLHKVLCQNPNPGGKDIGAACATNADCKSNTCAPFINTCSAVCTTDTDCGFAHCAQVKNGDWTSNACFARCQNDAECPEGNVCFLLSNPTGTLWTTGCNPPRPTGTPAGSEKGVDGCYTGLSTTIGTKTYCNKLCAGVADCTGVGPFTKCSKSNITSPDNVGTTSISTCAQ